MASDRRPRSIDMMKPTSTRSAKFMREKGKNYKFKLEDLTKYHSNLSIKDMQWKLKRSALGKVIPEPPARKKIIFKNSHFNTLKKVLQNTDWSTTPVYHQFKLYKKWKHTDDSIFSELDLQYHQSYLKKFNSEHYEHDDCHCEKEELVEKYYKKTMHTLEILMN
jgi:hypothetical protein